MGAIPKSDSNVNYLKAAEASFEEAPFNHKAISDFCIFTSDVSSGMSSVNDVAMTVFDNENKEGFSGLNMGVNNLAAGAASTTAGAINIVSNKNIAKLSHHTGDIKGFTQAFIKMTVQGPLEVASGTVNTVKNGIDVAAEAAGSSSMDHTMKGLGIAALTVNTALAVVVGGNQVANIIETRKHSKAFYEKLEEGGVEAGFKHLKEMHSITAKEKKKILQDLFKPKKEQPWYKKAKNFVADKMLGEKESDKEKEIRKALEKFLEDPNSMKEILKSEIPVKDHKDLSKEEKSVKTYLKNIKGYTKLTPLEKRKLLNLVMQLYDRDLFHYEEKKEAVFLRTMGFKTKELLLPLIRGDKKPTPEEIKRVVDSAKAGLFTNIAKQSSIILACTLSVIVGIILQVMTGGLYFVIQLALNLVIATIWLGLDAHALYQAYAEKHPSWKNRLLVALSTVVMVAVSAVVSTLANSMVNLGVTIALTFTWLSLILYGMYKWRKSSKREIKKIHAIKV